MILVHGPGDVSRVGVESEYCFIVLVVVFFFFQAEDGIRDRSVSRGLGDVYKRQDYPGIS